MVLPFLVNAADATFPEQAEPHAADIQTLLKAHRRTGVISGCAVTAQGSPDMTLAVADGVAIVDGKEVTVASGNVTITTADATDPRIDVVTVNGSGTKAVTAGTPAADPLVPATADNLAILARVYVPANDTAIANDQINDQRVFVESFWWKDATDYGADPTGVSDSGPAIQAALDALPAAGGVVLIQPGTYKISTGIVITDNAPIKILAYGATLEPDATVTALKINQGNVNARGVIVEGLVIDGNSAATTVGIEWEDTSNSELCHCQIENCATGLLYDSQASGGYVEGSHLDNVVFRQCNVSIDFSINLGTGSFAQTRWHAVKIVVGSTSPAVGVRVPANSLLVRSNLEVTVWIGTDETAMSLDGNLEDTTIWLAIEGASGSTGNVGLTIGTNFTNASQFQLIFLTTGTIATLISNAFLKHFIYNAGGQIWAASSGSSPWGLRLHGDSTDRVRFTTLTAGGKIALGNGSTLDVEIYRNSSTTPTLRTNVGFTMAGIARGSLPSASNVVEGTVVYVTDEDILVASDGTEWRVLNPRIVEVTGTVNLTTTDSRRVLNCDTASAVTINLPDNAGAIGKGFLIRRDGANDVTINRAGSDTFDDAATSKTLGSDGAAIGILSIGDGEWKIVSTQGTVT